MKAIRGELRILDLHEPTYVCSLEDRPPENLQKVVPAVRNITTNTWRALMQNAYSQSSLNPSIEHEKERNDLNL
jgi:hypothetical protein